MKDDQLYAHSFKALVDTDLIRKDVLEGRECLVAPCILLTPGVRNNVLYPEAELAKTPEAWNGRPLVAPTHPTANGKPVTANSKKMLERMGVGRLLNVLWDAERKKLKGEAWVDVVNCKARAPKVLSTLQDGGHMEVSTGLFTDDEFHGNAASFNGKKYKVLARNYRPDHLALLTDEKGACSWEDGAGIPRINAEEETDESDIRDNVDKTTDDTKAGPEQDVCPDCGEPLDKNGDCSECDDMTPMKKKMKEIRPRANTRVGRFFQDIGDALRINEDDSEDTEESASVSFDEIRQMLQQALDARYKPTIAGTLPDGGTQPTVSTYIWVQDAMTDAVVFGWAGKSWLLGYEITTDGEVELDAGEPVEVRRKQSWVHVNSEEQPSCAWVPVLTRPWGLRTLGGDGSGNWGHEGRPGERGGSASATGSSDNRMGRAPSGGSPKGAVTGWAKSPRGREVREHYAKSEKDLNARVRESKKAIRELEEDNPGVGKRLPAKYKERETRLANMDPTEKKAYLGRWKKSTGATERRVWKTINDLSPKEQRVALDTADMIDAQIKRSLSRPKPDRAGIREARAAASNLRKYGSEFVPNKGELV